MEPEYFGVKLETYNKVIQSFKASICLIVGKKDSSDVLGWYNAMVTLYIYICKLSLIFVNFSIAY
jgi:hypothetical protein